jgi:carnitine O-acetyltransferase
LGAFTAWDRPAWANNRDKLIKLNPKNATNFDTIETSLMVLSLDPSSPATAEEAGKKVLGGDANNRWFDKLIQVVVFANGRAGFNGEHSPLDAVATQSRSLIFCRITFVAMCDYMFNFAAKDTAVADTNVKAASPEKLSWTTSQEIDSALAETDKLYSKLYNDIDYTILRYSGYGSNWIKVRYNDIYCLILVSGRCSNES